LSILDDILADAGAISNWNMGVDSPEAIVVKDLRDSLRELCKGEVVELRSRHNVTGRKCLVSLNTVRNVAKLLRQLKKLTVNGEGGVDREF